MRIYAELKNAEDSEGKTRLQILLVGYEIGSFIGWEMILGEMLVGLYILLVGGCTLLRGEPGPARRSRLARRVGTPLTRIHNYHPGVSLLESRAVNR